MVGVITVGFCGVALLILLIIILKSYTRFNEIDKKYGKPYMAKLVKMIGGHPKLKRGSMAISFHPKGAIAFNRKVFLFSQIGLIKVIHKLPQELTNGKKTTVDFGVEEQYLCIVVTDESGEHEVVFTTGSGFQEVANELIQKWNLYNLISR
ncbi:hypothetical protein [Desulfosporosinus sp. SB140]|uniref:hypothetical protein n=1 Tax=Desulfosporosinus paludis TaxID=3115649 RepID=UPI00389005A9